MRAKTRSRSKRKLPVHNRLSLNDLANRTRDRTHLHYTNINALVKSGVAVIAATTLIHIGQQFGQTYNLWMSAPRVCLWVCSSLFTLITFVTWSRGSQMTNSRQNTRDFLFPMIIGFVELVFFLILDPEIVKQLNHVLGVWFAAVAAHTFFAFLLVLNRYRQTDLQLDFEESIHPLAAQYLRWIRGDIAATLLICTSTSILSFFAWQWWRNASYGELTWFSAGTLFVVSILSAVIFRMTKRESLEISEFVAVHHDNLP